jgi:hypothetical protein
MSIDEDKQLQTQAKGRQDAQKEQQEQAEEAQQEQEEAAQGPAKPVEGAAQTADIPDTPTVRMARQFLQQQPNVPGDVMEQNLRRRGIMLRTETRKALVQEEVQHRKNMQEDQGQVAETGQPISAGQKIEQLIDWAEEVVKGERAYVHIPEGMNFTPGGLEKMKRTKVKGAKPHQFNGTYYHPAEIQEADIRTAAQDETNPQAALDALSAKWKGNEMSVELASHSRSNLMQWAPQLVTVLVIVAGIAAWFYHSHEVKRRAAESVEAAAAAREQQARSIVTRVRDSWNADDNWEDAFSSKGAAYTPYTIEIESALIKGRPIIAFGDMEDVRKSGEQDNSIVLIQDIGRKTGIDLRFSLLSAPAITKAILNDEDRQSDTFVIAATITSVEKVSMPPDKSDNDQDYFLAHGVLHEAQPIGLWDMHPFKDLLSQGRQRSGDE